MFVGSIQVEVKCANKAPDIFTTKTCNKQTSSNQRIIALKSQLALYKYFKTNSLTVSDILSEIGHE